MDPASSPASRAASGAAESPARPREAATVLLLRERGGELEVLMQRRRASLQFMGGMWVFPGGAVDAADATPASLARAWHPELDRCRPLHAYESGDELSTGRALTLRVAACRETFEEAGLLLARAADGSQCPPARLAGVLERRGDVVQRASAFTEILAAADLYLDVGALVYWSHWITPSFEQRRFDTRFFAIAAPPGQSVCDDDGESSERGWMRPDAVLAARRRGEMPSAPPTLATLEDLAECFAAHGSVAALLAAEAGRPTPPVLPKLTPEESGVRVVLPWDPDYDATPGDGVARAFEYPPQYTRRPSSYRLTGPAAAGGGPSSRRR